MSRFGPFGILALVTPLLVTYGTSPWAWVGGPLAALAVWALEGKKVRTADTSDATRPAPGAPRNVTRPVGR